jgi:hypothetical protein
MKKEKEKKEKMVDDNKVIETDTNKSWYNKVTASAVDKWRIVPRLLMIMYGIAFYQCMTWFMGLEDPTLAQAGFVSTIVGAGAAWFGLYVGSGKK